MVKETSVSCIMLIVFLITDEFKVETLTNNILEAIEMKLKPK